MAQRLTKQGDGTSAARWRARLDRFTRVRQTVAAFCAAERVSVPAYYYWRKRLGSEGLPAMHASGRFIDVGPVRAAAAMTGAAPAPTIEVRLDLGGGLLLHIVRR